MKRENVKKLDNGTLVYPTLIVQIELDGVAGKRKVELKESNGLFTGSIIGKTTLTFQWNAKKYPVPVVKCKGRLIEEAKRESAQQMVIAALKAYKAAFATLESKDEAATATEHQQPEEPKAPLSADTIENYYA